MPVRILALELATAAPLDELRRFYGETIGLRILARDERRLTLAAGASEVTFTASAGDGAVAAPFYHFAFNIPQNKCLAARDWQKARTPLMPVPERLRDPTWPDDVVHFSHWNAHSVFFYDPAGNVVEYIARHDLGNDADGPFGTADILCASEIAYVVDDVAAASAQLATAAGVSQYRGGDEQFRALGDEHGLLLVMQRGRTLNFNPDDPGKRAGVFPTRARVRGAVAAKLALAGFPHELVIER